MATGLLYSVPTEELLLELRRRIVFGHGRWVGEDSGPGALTPRGNG